MPKPNAKVSRNSGRLPPVVGSGGLVKGESRTNNNANAEEEEHRRLFMTAQMLKHPELTREYHDLVKQVDICLKRQGKRQGREAPQLDISYALIQCVLRVQPPNVRSFIRVWQRADETERAKMEQLGTILPRPKNIAEYCRKITPEIVEMMAPVYAYAAAQKVDSIDPSDGVGPAWSAATRLPALQQSDPEPHVVALRELEHAVNSCREFVSHFHGDNVATSLTEDFSSDRCRQLHANLQEQLSSALDCGVSVLAKHVRHAKNMDNVLSTLQQKIDVATSLQAHVRGFQLRRKLNPLEDDASAGDDLTPEWFQTDHYVRVADSWRWTTSDSASQPSKAWTDGCQGPSGPLWVVATDPETGHLCEIEHETGNTKWIQEQHQCGFWLRLWHPDFSVGGGLNFEFGHYFFNPLLDQFCLAESAPEHMGKFPVYLPRRVFRFARKCGLYN